MATTDAFGPVFRAVQDEQDTAHWQDMMRQDRVPQRVVTSGDVQSLISDIAPRYGVDPRLVQAVAGIESGGNPIAVSRKGAGGIMQLMPGTARRFGVTDTFNAQQNIEGGVRYLSWLQDQFPGRVDLQLAAYHAGEGAVRNAGYQIPDTHDGNVSTAQYVQMVLGRYGRGTVPGSLGSSPLGVRADLATQAMAPQQRQQFVAAPDEPGMQSPGLPSLAPPAPTPTQPAAENPLRAETDLAHLGDQVTWQQALGQVGPLQTAEQLRTTPRTARPLTPEQELAFAAQPTAGPREQGAPLEPGLKEPTPVQWMADFGSSAVDLVGGLFRAGEIAEIKTGLKTPGQPDPLMLGKIADVVDEASKSMESRRGGDAPTFFNKLAGALGTSFTSLFPAVAAEAFLAKVAGMAAPTIVRLFGLSGGAQRAGQVAGQMTKLGQAGSAAVIEAAGEGSDLYNQLKPLVGEQQAADRALQSFAANTVLITLTDRLGIFGDESRLLRRMLNGVVTNGLQEYVQYDIENKLMWVPQELPGAQNLLQQGWQQQGDRIVKPFVLKDAAEATAIGMILGPVGAAAVGHAAGELQPVQRVKQQEQAIVKAQIPDTLVKDAQGNPKQMYHGTNAAFESFAPAKAIQSSLYGPGFYFTDNPQVATGYAQGQAAGPVAPDLLVSPEQARQALKKVPGLTFSERESVANLDDNELAATIQNMADRGYEIDASSLIGEFRGQPNIRPVYLDIRNPFDIDATLPVEQQRTIALALAQHPEGRRLGYYPTEATQGGTFYDQIVKAMGNNREKANTVLQSAGYDGIAHTGGAITGGELHQVYIAFRPEQVIPAFSINAAIQAAQNPNAPPPGVDQTTWQRWGQYLRDLLPAGESGMGLFGSERGAIGGAAMPGAPGGAQPQDRQALMAQRSQIQQQLQVLERGDEQAQQIIQDVGARSASEAQDVLQARWLDVQDALKRLPAVAQPAPQPGPTVQRGAEGIPQESYRKPDGSLVMPLKDIPSQELELQDFLWQPDAQGRRGIKLATETDVPGELRARISVADVGREASLQNNASGLTLQQQAERAQQQGFIPTANKEDLLDAMDRSIVQGKPVYSVNATGTIHVLHDPYVRSSYQALLNAVNEMKVSTSEAVGDVQHRREVHAQAADLIGQGLFTEQDIRDVEPGTPLPPVMTSAMMQSMNTIAENLGQAAQTFLESGARLGSREEAALQQIMGHLAELEAVRKGVSATLSRSLGILNDPLSSYTRYLNNLHKVLETAPQQTMANIAKRILAAEPREVTPEGQGMPAAKTAEYWKAHPDELNQLFADMRDPYTPEPFRLYSGGEAIFQAGQQEELLSFETPLTPAERALADRAYQKEAQAYTPEEWNAIWKANAQERIRQTFEASRPERERQQAFAEAERLEADLAAQRQREHEENQRRQDWTATEKAQEQAYFDATQVWAQQAWAKADQAWRESYTQLRIEQEQRRAGYPGRELSLPPGPETAARVNWETPVQLLLGIPEHAEAQAKLDAYLKSIQPERDAERLEKVLRPWLGRQEQQQFAGMVNNIRDYVIQNPEKFPFMQQAGEVRAQVEQALLAQGVSDEQGIKQAQRAALLKSTQPGFEQFFLELWFNAMFSNPGTHAANLFGNLSTTLWAIPERFIAEQFTFKGQDHVTQGESTAMTYGLVHSIQDAWAGAVRSFQEGRPMSGLGREYVRDPVMTARNIGLDPNSQMGRFADFMFNYIGAPIWPGLTFGRLPTKLLMASDEFFKMLNYRAELNALAYREATSQGLEGSAWGDHVARILSSPNLSQLQEAATTYSVYQTFQNELTPGKLESSMANAAQAISNFSIPIPGLPNTNLPVGKAIVPFVQTPLNMALYSIERTPLGIFAANTQADLRAGGARQELAWARMTLGTLAMAGMAAYAFGGNMTGRGPEDPELREIWLDAHPEYSMKVPGVNLWIPYKRFLGPLGQLLGMVADTVQIAGEAHDDVVGKTIVGALYSVMKNINNDIFMKSLSDFFDIMTPKAASRPEDTITRLANYLKRNIAGVAQPSGFEAATARAFSPAEVEATDLMNQIYARTPGWGLHVLDLVNMAPGTTAAVTRAGVPARRTLGGEKVLYGHGVAPDVIATLLHSYFLTNLEDGMLMPADKEILANKMRLSKVPKTILPDALQASQLAQVQPEGTLQEMGPLRLTDAQHERYGVLASGNVREAQKLGLEIPEEGLRKLVEGLAAQAGIDRPVPSKVLRLDAYTDWLVQQPEYKAASGGQGGGKEAMFQQAVRAYRKQGLQLLLEQDGELSQQYQESTIQRQVLRLPISERSGMIRDLREGYQQMHEATREQLGLRQRPVVIPPERQGAPAGRQGGGTR